ncbi:hypothetical protein VW29_12780 [Devosia limi DSM 17137]|uniref:Uncharacterized protein n=1 Tax=Devosia limi DSM 17137 TaxID=1121477 RepID=A0A0F5LNR0_9HYPH|nr:hypothetical protein [Devosia limi]KKB83968.1 hypothetical protein VW29_12780 [Devosia limi DSM 17137]SHE45781.1 hypothetical protein SAMN02745223_00433 [Devosia limi DSM 17137]
MNKTILAIALLVSMIVPTAAKPFHHPYGEWREYNQDWLAACPDAIDEDAADYYGFSCFASTGSPDLNAAGLPAYKLTLMLNRLTGDIDIAVTVAADGVEVDQSRPLIMTFGGALPIRLDFSTDLETRYNTTNVYYVAEPDRSAALLEQMKSRNAVTVAFPISAGNQQVREVRFSLRGTIASLDFMTTYARRVADY